MAKQPKRGFWEYVKNPGLFWQEVREDDRAADRPAPRGDRLAAAVAALRARPPEYGELERLRKAGAKVVPPLVAALRDPAFLFHRYGPSVSDGSALETALDLLEPFAEPPAAVLEPALRHADEYFRSRALYHLGRCGHADAAPALTAGLASGSETDRTYALMGLEFLGGSDRGSEQFRRELFDAARPLLHDAESGPAEQAPRVLLALDRERAVSVLVAADVLRPDNPNVGRALRALNELEVPVPADRLRGLLAGLRATADEYPSDYAYADGLVLLARAEGEAAADLIADARGWSNERVRTAAAEAVMIAAGVADAEAVVLERFERAGVGGLSVPQLHYLTLSGLDAEVRNGGFAQYFFNSAGNLAGHAAAAAEAVGAAATAGLVREAVGLLGPAGPAADRDERMGQLGGISPAALRELDARYYDGPDVLRELLPLYAARHPADFRK